MRGTKVSRKTFWMMAAAGAVALAAPLIGQTVGEDEDVAGSLNIPKDITVFGNRDPNIRTATAIVNAVK